MMYDENTMTLFHRRLLVILFLIVFAISAPILVMYAAGYQYNTRLRRIEQLGLLYATTDPNGTKLTIDGQTYDVEKELVVDHLREGAYDVTVTKEGYHSWQKRLDIFQGKASFIRDIVLFADEQPQPREVFVDPMLVLTKTPSRVFFGKPGFVFMLNRQTLAITEIPLLTPDPVSKFAADDTSNVTVFQQANVWYRLDLNEAAVTELNIPGDLDVTAMVVKDNNLTMLTPAEIWQWDLKNPPELLTAHLLAQTFYSGENSDWILSTDASRKRTFLYELPSKNSRTVFLTVFPYSENMRISDVSGRLLTIHDADKNDLYLVDAQTLPPATEIISGAHTFAWSPDHRELLTATDFELAVQRVDHGKTQEVLTRISTPILDADWHAAGQHALYVTAEGLFAIERDARDRRNVAHLVKEKNDIRLLAQSPEGDQIIFASTNNGVSYVIWELRAR